ncbi:YbbN family protein [Bacillus velezensis]|uniref:thioredoxin n=1 Tax=Bacillus velezensis TaxID=492670 RepID=UPI0011A858AF|nr:thioredoxin [Bacillus velezensis]
MKLIKFELENCTPCKMLASYLHHELGVDVDETINISNGTITNNSTGVVEKDENKAMCLTGEFRVMKSPTLILLDEEGNEVDRFSGVGQTGVKAILAKRGLI